LNELGKGAFGTVYSVRRKTDGMIYALKRVKISTMTPKDRENALNEIRVLASLSHPNVVDYKEAFYDEESISLNIVMEFADEGDLANKIKTFRNLKTFIPENEIWSCLIQIIAGLKALHDKKIMHRDLKSANVFLTKKGEVKLGDLNVSKVVKMGFLSTQTGTPYYASPEVWSEKPYDYKSDIWSVGCIVYEMCALKPPFRAQCLENLFKAVTKGVYDNIPNVYSKELQNVIKSLLYIEPKKRPSCETLLNLPFIKKKIENGNFILSVCQGSLLNTIKWTQLTPEINKKLTCMKRYSNYANFKLDINNKRGGENNGVINNSINGSNPKTKIITNTNIKGIILTRSESNSLTPVHNLTKSTNSCISNSSNTAIKSSLNNIGNNKNGINSISENLNSSTTSDSASSGGKEIFKNSLSQNILRIEDASEKILLSSGNAHKYKSPIVIRKYIDLERGSSNLSKVKKARNILDIITRSGAKNKNQTDKQESNPNLSNPMNQSKTLSKKMTQSRTNLNLPNDRNAKRSNFNYENISKVKIDLSQGTSNINTGVQSKRNTAVISNKNNYLNSSNLGCLNNLNNNAASNGREYKVRVQKLINAAVATNCSGNISSISSSRKIVPNSVNISTIKTLTNKVSVPTSNIDKN
jgi:NIMA (never in mitosis gene a)-related kinase